MITGLEKIWKFEVRFDLSNKKYIAILGYLGNDRKINIPKSIYVNYEEINVTTIEDNAFADCTDLTSITIPYGVTTIGYSAFAYCSSITSIIVPASVTSIGSSAFFKGGYNVYYDNTDIPSTWKNDWKDNFQGNFYVKSATMPISNPNDSNIDGYWHYVNGKPEVLI